MLITYVGLTIKTQDNSGCAPYFTHSGGYSLEVITKAVRSSPLVV